MLLPRSLWGRPHVLQTVLFILTLLWCIAGICLAATTLPATTLPATMAPLEASSQPVTLSTVDALKKRQEELAQRRHRVEQLLESAKSEPTATNNIDQVRMELEVLKYYELVCAQHAEELERASDLKAEMTRWQTRLHDLRLVGPEELKPYSILLRDDIQDQLDAEKLRLQTSTTELSSAKDLQQTTLRMHKEAEAKRRGTKEALEVERDEKSRQRLAKQLDLDQLHSQLFADMVQLRRSEIATEELEREISQIRTTYLQEKLKVVAADTVFTAEHLQAVLAEFDKYETEMRSQLPQLQSRQQELETEAYDAAKEQSGQKPDKTLQAEMEAGSQVAKRNYQLQIKMVQQRLRDLVLARLEWNIRYKIVNGLATREQLVQWEKDAQLYLERIQASRQSLEDESRALMVELGRAEKQLRMMRRTNPQAAKWIEYRIASMHDLSQAYATNLVQVEMVERMLSKLTSSLSTDLKPADASDWLSVVSDNVKAAWDYELTSVDDRPITVSKVVSGVVLMLLGLYFSRRLSRLIGNRMLPRMGLQNGAATAIQSISFYLLITCFGFVSLELINVPLTVFTFLGGAVAIGVGFGSQNILNNFISGMILLAEQPIRVGDLVEVSGLCGNVEKIGARSTRVKTGSNLEIIVPNSKFLEDNVTNWTLSDTRMRTVVKVGVSYGSPTLDVSHILRRAVDECPNAMTEPEPIVLFGDFGDNALMFEVHFWIYVRTMMQARKIESELRHVIDRMMREANITIAFPQRDVHLDTLKPIEVNLRQVAEQQGFAVRRREAA